ncbi:MAG: tRNA (adenosine(37)-N6)-threonylcarbamoyltransferase complex transferase subunit TsaD [Phycisphaerales bacterium]|jgi:N6-L-threonylcarbamoyladenine synthase|nr:tRNA (adenosine(37)-N6)-threonylcarbamoyltransferase complex transferase subunit TsaD [Phycisphaerales bacterium]
MPLTLGIETSCDESAAAVTDGPQRVRSSVIATQHDLHALYAGVVPEIASRAHLQRLTPVITEAVRQAGVSLSDIEAIAVGNRPGLIGSLLVGVSAAKALAWSLDVPLVGVHHLLAHLHAPSLDDGEIAFPAVSILASGGHTAVYHQTGPLEATLLGGTIDDAVGEAFDKAATMLEAGYPGGPAIERLAARGNDRAVDLPIARLGKDRLDFSFAGLKTALLYAVRGTPTGRGRQSVFPRSIADCDADRRADLAASFQRCAVSALVDGVERALDRTEARSLCGGGGVLANTLLRSRLEALAQSKDVPLRLPPMKYCVDNAAMIAGLGSLLVSSGRTDGLDLQAIARSPVGDAA